MKTRILLCSDEPILARGIEEVFSRVEGFESEPSCRTVPGLMKQLEGRAPDLLLLDLTKDVTCALLCELKRTQPNMKIVLWANAISAEMAFAHSTIFMFGCVRLSSHKSAHVTSFVRSSSSRSGARPSSCFIKPGTVRHDGSDSNPSTRLNTSSIPLARIGSSLQRRMRVFISASLEDHWCNWSLPMGPADYYERGREPGTVRGVQG